MAQYRKIDTRMWGDAKFRELSQTAKFLWIYLLTGPETTSLPGVLVGGPAHFSEKLGWQPKDFLKAFQEVSDKGMAKANWGAHLVWIPNAIHYNKPQSPNVVVSWQNHWDAAPECELKDEAYRVFETYLEGLGPAFGMAFRKAFRKDKAIQDQDQDQDPLTSFEGGAGGPHRERDIGSNGTGGVQPEQKFSLTSPKPPAKGQKAGRMTTLPEDWQPNAEHYRKCEANGFPRAWVDKQFESMRDWSEANGKKYVSWDAMFRHWLARAMDQAEQDSGRTSAGRKPSPPPRESKNPAHQPFPEPKEPPPTPEQVREGLKVAEQLIGMLDTTPSRRNGKNSATVAPVPLQVAPTGQNGTPPAGSTKDAL